MWIRSGVAPKNRFAFKSENMYICRAVAVARAFELMQKLSLKITNLIPNDFQSRITAFKINNNSDHYLQSFSINREQIN